MNYNIAGYCIYLFFTFTIIVYVGQLCYKNGKVYSLQIFKGDIDLTNNTNNILLLCYYLFNLGYCLITIYSWQTLYSWKECINSVSIKAGLILMSLGALHLMNITILLFISHKQKYFSHQNLSS